MARYLDDSASFLSGIEQKIEEEKRRLSALRGEVEGAAAEAKTAGRRKEITLENEAEKAYIEYLAQVKQSVVNNPLFVGREDVPGVMQDFPSSEEIFAQAKKRVLLPTILVGRKYERFQGRDRYLIPQYLPWQCTWENSHSNFLITFEPHKRREAVNFTNQMLMRMVMAFTPDKIRFSFLDPLNSNDSIFFTQMLKGDPDIYYGKTFTRDSIQAHLQMIGRKMEETQKAMSYEFTTITAQNFKAEKIIKPYEVVVIYDYDRLEMCHTELMPLLENGNKFGIYFIILEKDDGGDKRYDPRMRDLLSDSKFFKVTCMGDRTYHALSPNGDPAVTFRGLDYIPYKGATNLIDVTGEGTRMMSDYLGRVGELAQKLKKKNEAKVDLKVFRDTFEDAGVGFTIPVGISSDEAVFNFVLDEKTMSHTFVLGQTGSGKSGLLHAILTTAVLKYSPQTLQLYLIDFKEGGVEFDTYGEHRIPHARAILADNSDRQIVLEIMQNIAREMRHRGKLFREAEVSELHEYNQKMPEEKRLPRIIIAVDECQKLFSLRGNDPVTEVVTRVASEGRNQGIHLILATQTLYDANIPEAVQKNIANKFVLKSQFNDAVKLIAESTPDVEKFVTGEGLYKTGSILVKFRAYHIKPERDELLDKSYAKSLALTGGDTAALSERFPTFIFRGSQLPEMDGIRPDAVKSGMPMIVGKEIGMNEHAYAHIPIQKRQYAYNLLIVGNKGIEDGDAERNAMRVVISSLRSLDDYYRQAAKPYRVFVINRLESEEGTESMALRKLSGQTNIRILDNQPDMERTLLELSSRIDSGRSEEQDTYLYILGQQRFYELRNDFPLGQSPSAGIIEDLSMPGLSQSYKSVLTKIAKHGTGLGIHTVVQLDRISALFIDEYELKQTFGYAVLLGMSDLESGAITRGLGEEVSTDSLSTEAERLRAYLFDNFNSKVTLFVPFVIPKELLSGN